MLGLTTCLQGWILCFIYTIVVRANPSLEAGNQVWRKKMNCTTATFYCFFNLIDLYNNNFSIIGYISLLLPLLLEVDSLVLRYHFWCMIIYVTFQHYCCLFIEILI